MSLKENISFCALFFIAALGLPHQAMAGRAAVASDTSQTASSICLYDGAGDATGTIGNCPTSGGTDNTNAAAGMGGAKISPNHTAVTPIDKHWKCRYVNNASSAYAQFIPFKTPHEWDMFLQNKPSSFSINLCSRPDNSFSITNFVPDGDQAKDGVTSYNISLPYARESTQLHYEHTFTNQCKQYVWECDGRGYNSCCVGGTTDEWNNCNGGEYRQDSSCGCVQNVCNGYWRDYSSSSGFTAVAGVSSDSDAESGWQGYSYAISSTRSNVCTTDSGCNPSVQPYSGCSLDDMHLYNSFTMLFCTTGSVYWNTCLGLGFGVLNYENQISAALASGTPEGCATAQALRTDENNIIDIVNNASPAWAIGNLPK